MSEPAWTMGGRGGTVAVLADLEIAEGALREAADELDLAGRALATASLLGAPAGASLQPSAVACTREADALRDLAMLLATAVEAYRAAEAEAHHGVSTFSYGLDIVGDSLGTAWRVLRETVTGGVVGLVGALPEMPTTGSVNRATVSAKLGAMEERYDALVDDLLMAVRGAEHLLEPEFAGARPATLIPTTTAPASVEELLGRLTWLEGIRDGSVAVETLEGADGPRHIVYIPSTQDWGLLGGNPADLEADLAAVRGGWSDAAASVVDALRGAGVRADEPVMLVGHSQGGMIASVVASALGGAFRITQVVTAGSPTGRIAIPSSTEALHLENLRDLVPGLDGRANDPSPNRTTVTHDRRHSLQDDAPDASHTVLQAHGLPGYRQTARLVDEGLTPSTEAWLDGAAPMLVGGRSTIRTFRPVTG
ncbi:D-alanine--poly(phosphoribitol) ligase [Demequina mangrovi]|uniref:PGAP1-like protein n=1 Tax=Demequina mangrovi TaxID=1043493 RepID=A0A1H7A0B1_9MICO|nr:D-alanine--poly(phosphoribitol) ligase [Demequina mangrovi]SEJ59129.1 hypothetical protein SAMN05421637_2332 [Demequina mangrovi]